MDKLDLIDFRLELFPKYYSDKLNEHRRLSSIEMLNMFSLNGLMIIDRTITLYGTFDEWLIQKGLFDLIF